MMCRSCTARRSERGERSIPIDNIELLALAPGLSLPSCLALITEFYFEAALAHALCKYQKFHTEPLTLVFPTVILCVSYVWN